MRAVFLSLRSGNAGCRGYDGIYFKDKVIGGVDMKEDIIDYVLDIRGEPWPYPVINALDALQNMKIGEVLQVIADCPQSFMSVPEEVVKHGYELVSEPEKHGHDIYFLIRVSHVA